MARGEDHGYRPRAGAFLASSHVAQEVAWLQAEVTWSMTAAEPPLGVEGGTCDLAGDPPVAAIETDAGALVIPAGGHPLRCHALLFSLGIEGGDEGAAVGVELAAREAGEWQVSASFEMPGWGTYLGLVALEKRPRTIESVRVALRGAKTVRVYDLALLTFG
jgi:hypothetical protein